MIGAHASLWYKLAWQHIINLGHDFGPRVDGSSQTTTSSINSPTPTQGKPIVTLNGIKNRCTKWQCVTIPSECPHAIDNDLNEEVVILWNYVSLTDKVSRKTLR